jgi:hypothetical protein
MRKLGTRVGEIGQRVDTGTTDDRQVDGFVRDAHSA